MTLNTTGLDAFLAGLDEAIDMGVQDATEAIEQKAVATVPVLTGALQTSIQINGVEGSGERTVEAGQGLDYAAWVEYGSSKAPAQPFMTPAAEQTDVGAFVAKRIAALAGGGVL
jgi:HK97 gp10 family phage protein